jgi:DNA-binding NarL/FixJ family response regulator
MRIVIAAFQTAVRTALQAFLQEKLQPEEISGVSNSRELMAWLDIEGPNVILLLDWALPDGPVTALLAALRARAVRPKVIVLGSAPDQRRAALAAGADGFVTQSDPPRRLLSAIRNVQKEHGDD